MVKSLAIGIFLVTCVSSFGSTQKLPPPSDAQATALASQSMFALTGGNAISDVSFTGSVTVTAGSTAENGTATLLALGKNESRMNLVLSGGTRTEIRDSSTGTARGQWTAENGSSGAFAVQNCSTDAVWFYPPLGSLAAAPNVVLSYIGQESRNGETVQHIQSYTYLYPDYSSPSIQQLSTMDYYLDATTLQPVAITYNTHPDTNAGANISVEVDLSNYQSIGGILAPMHIQMYLQGTLSIDIVVSSVSFNSGLTLSTFSIN